MATEEKWPTKMDRLEFKNLTDAQQLSDYFYNRAWHHEYYYHYTDRDAADNIMKSKTFWLGCVADCNDVCDRDQFRGGANVDEPSSELELYYVLCFSTSTHDNLPMWYFYGGLDGKGARIGFTQNGIEKLVDCKYYLCECKQQDTREPYWGIESYPDKIMELEQGVSMEMHFHDILYSEESKSDEMNPLMDMKFSTLTNHSVRKTDVKKYHQSPRGFGKGIIWAYERECRLLVKLIGEAADRVQRDSKHKYRVVLQFDEAILKNGSARITFGPGYPKGVPDFIQSFPVEKQEANRYAGTVQFSLKSRV